MLMLTFLIATQAFPNNGAIPPKYTCDGKDISPSITWSNIPEKTKSMALIVDDPDAIDDSNPKLKGYTHWVLYNIPPTALGIAENIKSTDLPKGTLEGKNDWGKTGYGGPCPPSGQHRYFFKLYALDITLPDLNNPTKEELEKNMAGHIIEKTEWMGTYSKIK